MSDFRLLKFRARDGIRTREPSGWQPDALPTELLSLKDYFLLLSFFINLPNVLLEFLLPLPLNITLLDSNSPVNIIFFIFLLIFL